MFCVRPLGFYFSLVAVSGSTPLAFIAHWGSYVVILFCFSALSSFYDLTYSKLFPVRMWNVLPLFFSFSFLLYIATKDFVLNSALLVFYCMSPFCFRFVLILGLGVLHPSTSPIQNFLLHSISTFLFLPFSRQHRD